MLAGLNFDLLLALVRQQESVSLFEAIFENRFEIIRFVTMFYFENEVPASITNLVELIEMLKKKTSTRSS